MKSWITGGVIIFILITGTVFLLSDGQSSRTVSGENDEPEETDSVETIKETVPAYTITAAYPRVGIGAEAVEEYVQNQIAAFKPNALEAFEENEEFFRQHELQITYEKYSHAGFVSYVVTEYIYRGGAHGVQMVETFVFIGNDERVDLFQVVPESNREELLRAIEEEVRDINGLSEGEPLAYDLTLADVNHFYLTDESLVIVFDQYSVAPGAAGVVSIELPVEQYVTLE